MKVFSPIALKNIDRSLDRSSVFYLLSRALYQAIYEAVFPAMEFLLFSRSNAKNIGFSPYSLGNVALP
jgi:hypothetical protein